MKPLRLSIGGAKLRSAASLVPGVALCLAIAVTASLAQAAEVRWLHRPWLESIALSIVLGVIVRLAGSLQSRWIPGVTFSAKFVLEVAVVLLGASISVTLLHSGGPWLLLGVVAAVVVSLAGSFALGRLLGLTRNQATLVACGNSICGNSAIAAVAPVIRADHDDIAASITFTAVLSIVVVVGLPYLAPLMKLSPLAYGVIAGMTVYAVPQVVAATAPLGAVAMQAGALVKLTRVLMLAPAIAGVAALSRAYPDRSTQAGPRTEPSRVWAVPWFVLGFLVLMGLRAGGVMTDQVAHLAAQLSAWLTGLAMAALGLMVDVRTVFRSGSRVSMAATLSVLLIGVIGLALVHMLGLA